MRKMTCKKRSVNQPSRLFLFLCTAPTLILTVYFILVPTLKAFDYPLQILQCLE